VATDIDGTIMPRSGRVSARTKRALGSLSDAGVPLVLVTARPPRWLDAVAEQLNIEGTAVCANGAVQYDLGTRRIIDAITIAADPLIETVQLLRDALPGSVFAVETTRGIALEEEFPTAARGLKPREVARIEAMEAARDDSVIKLLAALEVGDHDEMLAIAEPLVGHLVEASHSSAEVPLLEFAPSGVTKASGLARMAAHFGVDPADVIAFGDAPNDLPMLAWAGTSYAVANAHPDVLAIATHSTASVDEDGVAIIVEEILVARGLTP
jgi:Cof subfamily protein (haloacid dehalogenase superfamily)